MTTDPSLRQLADALPLSRLVTIYANTKEFNDALHGVMTVLASGNELLVKHRSYLEEFRWGFGDRAFHFMWLLILADIQTRTQRAKFLEIGVYRGATISLWGLLAKHLELAINITGVSLFSGSRARDMDDIDLWNAIRTHSFYPPRDYIEDVKRIFRTFDLDQTKLELVQGDSTEPKIIEHVSVRRYDLIYIDGGHFFESVSADISNYSQLLAPGGILVLDDASVDLPGSKYWKGLRDVSSAATLLPNMGFTNILNVGHNRLYKLDQYA